MTSEILVPLDGSRRAEAVLPFVVTLAHAQKSTVVLLRVLAPPIISSFWFAHASAFSQAAHDEESMVGIAYLADQAQRLEAAHLPVETELLFGDPARCIVERAARSPCNCRIAMASHGHGGAMHWFFGSVAAKIVHAAPVPLLVVRADTNDTATMAAPVLKTILVALDGSSFAACALHEARELARKTGAMLLLVSVLDEPLPGEDEAARSGDTTAGATHFWTSVDRLALRDQVASYLRRVAQPIERDGIQVRRELANGNPAEAILRVSEEQQADLVVLATHGHTGFHGLWLGGVAVKVVQRSKCPVLLIRPNVDWNRDM